MNLSKIITSIEYISEIKDLVLLCKKGTLNAINQLKTIEFGKLSYIKFINKDKIVVKFDGRLNVYNERLEIVSSLINQIIKPSSGLYVLPDNFYVFLNFNIGYQGVIMKNDIEVKYLQNFWGIFLNQYFRLNFLENTFGNSKYFRCSDLLDEKTYWEYTCPTGLQASNTWVVRGEYLLFCENTDGSYQGNIKKIHLPTGELKWEAAVPMTRLHYNESQGLFVSFWANVNYGPYYQIIDIDNETIEFGNPITDVTLQNLPSTEGTLYLYERKLYFTDFSNAYGDQIPNIMFGCFDIDTKKVDFLQEVPEAKGDGFAQIIYSDNKLYLRSFENKLYVYEHETTAS